MERTEEDDQRVSFFMSKKILDEGQSGIAEGDKVGRGTFLSSFFDLLQAATPNRPPRFAQPALTKLQPEKIEHHDSHGRIRQHVRHDEEPDHAPPDVDLFQLRDSTVTARHGDITQGNVEGIFGLDQTSSVELFECDAIDPKAPFKISLALPDSGWLVSNSKTGDRYAPDQSSTRR